MSFSQKMLQVCSLLLCLTVVPATEKGTADEADDAIEELEGDIEELDGAIEELEDAMDDVIGGAVVEGASLLQYSSNALRSGEEKLPLVATRGSLQINVGS